MPISVVIPVRNEAANLLRCLEKLERFEEIVVVDSNSDDATRDIARDAGASVIPFDWDGRYPKKRNWYMLNHRPACDWVLFLDADELVSEAFCDEVARAVSAEDCDGYWLNYTNYFLGRPLKHGDRQRKLALFRFGKALYERIDEDSWSGLDMEVHEHPIVEGKVGEIAARIDHDDYRGLAQFIDRHRDYAVWEARRTLALRGGGNDAWQRLTPRQQKKYRNIGKWWFAWSYFLYCYVLKRGFLDGGPGFALAFYKLWYFRTIRLLLREFAGQEGA
ncbi:MAG: glycosyltransferase family 2 protein [Sphingomonadaceae bacterium]|nr:glycosyltransferase family 2 protein [Sphingomonadaceae bacterium]